MTTTNRQRESFVLYTSLFEQVRDLTLEQKGILFDAIHNFVLGVEYSIDDPLTNMAFRFYRNQLEIDLRKWDDVRQKRSEAGKLGGRPPKEKDEKQTKAKKANAFSEKQTKAKKADNVNVNVNVDEYVNVNNDGANQKNNNEAADNAAEFIDKLAAGR